MGSWGHKRATASDCLAVRRAGRHGWEVRCCTLLVHLACFGCQRMLGAAVPLFLFFGICRPVATACASEMQQRTPWSLQGSESECSLSGASRNNLAHRSMPHRASELLLSPAVSAPLCTGVYACARPLCSWRKAALGRMPGHVQQSWSSTLAWGLWPHPAGNRSSTGDGARASCDTPRWMYGVEHSSHMSTAETGPAATSAGALQSVLVHHSQQSQGVSGRDCSRVGGAQTGDETPHGHKLAVPWLRPVLLSLFTTGVLRAAELATPTASHSSLQQAQASHVPVPGYIPLGPGHRHGHGHEHLKVTPEAGEDAVAEGEFEEGTEADEDALVRGPGQISTAGQLLAGGVAGAVSKTCTAPLARLTILFQVQGMDDVQAVRMSRPSIWVEARRILKEEGVQAFWKGNTVTIIHRLPYSAINFFAYESYKGALEDLAAEYFFADQESGNTHAPDAPVQPSRATAQREAPASGAAGANSREAQASTLPRGGNGAAGSSGATPVGPASGEEGPGTGTQYDTAAFTHDVVDVGIKLLAGGGAGITAATLTYPLDLVRTRLAAQRQSKYYKGILGTMATIARDEGVLGLYKGMGATLLGVGPNLAINFCVYETVKAKWVSANPDTPAPLVSLGCGSLAGICSSTATFPLDLVRRRMQLEGAGGRKDAGGSGRAAQKCSRGIPGTFAHIVRTEGWRALYRGIVPEYWKVVPGVSIAFMTYEFMKRMLMTHPGSGAHVGVHPGSGPQEQGDGD